MTPAPCSVSYDMVRHRPGRAASESEPAGVHRPMSAMYIGLLSYPRPPMKSFPWNTSLFSMANPPAFNRVRRI